MANSVPRAGELMRKCCALDLDGVLVNTDALHYTALNLALEKFGVRIEPGEHLAFFKGLPTRVKCEMLVRSGVLPPGCGDEVNAEKQRQTLRAIRESVAPDARKLALLAEMAADGWRLAVCSNAVRATVDALLDAIWVTDMLEFSLSNEDAAPKPAPDIYWLAAKRFGIHPARLVVVEDAPAGRKAALDAGCVLVPVGGPEEVSLELLPKIAAAWLVASGDATPAVTV